MRIYGPVSSGYVSRPASPSCTKRLGLRNPALAGRVRRRTKPERSSDVDYPVHIHPKSPYSGQNSRIPAPALGHPLPKDEVPAKLRGVFRRFFQESQPLDSGHSSGPQTTYGGDAQKHQHRHIQRAPPGPNNRQVLQSLPAATPSELRLTADLNRRHIDALCSSRYSRKVCSATSDWHRRAKDVVMRRFVAEFRAIENPELISRPLEKLRANVTGPGTLYRTAPEMAEALESTRSQSVYRSLPTSRQEFSQLRRNGNARQSPTGADCFDTEPGVPFRMQAKRQEAGPTIGLPPRTS